MMLFLHRWHIAKCVPKKGGRTMATIPKSPRQVEEFLERVKEVLKKEDCVIINDDEWADGRENKTRTYMTEKNLKRLDVIRVLQKLQVRNYAYTEEDRNRNFAKQEVWFFGINEYMVDEVDELYVKFKMITLDEEYIKVMSFHPERPSKAEEKLNFPYDK